MDWIGSDGRLSVRVPAHACSVARLCENCSSLTWVVGRRGRKRANLPAKLQLFCPLSPPPPPCRGFSCCEPLQELSREIDRELQQVRSAEVERVRSVCTAANQCGLVDGGDGGCRLCPRQPPPPPQTAYAELNTHTATSDSSAGRPAGPRRTHKHPARRRAPCRRTINPFTSCPPRASLCLPLCCCARLPPAASSCLAVRLTRRGGAGRAQWQRQCN